MVRASSQGPQLLEWSLLPWGDRSEPLSDNGALCETAVSGRWLGAVGRGLPVTEIRLVLSDWDETPRWSAGLPPGMRSSTDGSKHGLGFQWPQDEILVDCAWKSSSAS